MIYSVLINRTSLRRAIMIRYRWEQTYCTINDEELKFILGSAVFDIMVSIRQRLQTFIKLGWCLIQNDACYPSCRPNSFMSRAQPKTKSVQNGTLLRIWSASKVQEAMQLSGKKVDFYDEDDSNDVLICCVGLDHIISRKIRQQYQAAKTVRKRNVNSVLRAQLLLRSHHVYISPEVIADISRQAPYLHENILTKLPWRLHRFCKHWYIGACYPAWIL